jgi:type II secretory pathway predicted ATPase ExeA
LISTLYYDLSQDKQVQIPKQSEKRERELQEIVKKGKRPVALFVDEAHDLNGHTLIGLKRLMEVVEDAGGRLSVILAGHPKLRNDLRRPTMEEIGYRTDIFTLDGVAGSQREYILWLLAASTTPNTDPESILDGEAIDILSTKLRTPLQVQLHLTLALEAGYQTGEKPVTAALVETVLSRQLDDLEPTLTRHGYRLKDMVEQFDAKPAEIRALFNNKLEPARTAELRDRMLAAGLPI